MTWVVTFNIEREVNTFFTWTYREFNEHGFNRRTDRPMPKLVRKRAIRRQRGWGPQDRSGIDPETRNPADVERTELKHTAER